MANRDLWIVCQLVERLSRALTFPKTIFCPQKLLWGKFFPCVGHLLTIIPPLFHTTQSAVRAISQLFLSWTQKYLIVKKITTYSLVEALTSPLLLYSKRGVLGQGGNNIDAPFNPSQIAEYIIRLQRLFSHLVKTLSFG